jgi:hypothetical protein
MMNSEFHFTVVDRDNSGSIDLSQVENEVKNVMRITNLNLTNRFNQEPNLRRIVIDHESHIILYTYDQDDRLQIDAEMPFSEWTPIRPDESLTMLDYTPYQSLKDVPRDQGAPGGPGPHTNHFHQGGMIAHLKIFGFDANYVGEPFRVDLNPQSAFHIKSVIYRMIRLSDIGFGAISYFNIYDVELYEMIYYALDVEKEKYPDHATIFNETLCRPMTVYVAVKSAPYRIYDYNTPIAQPSLPRPYLTRPSTQDTTIAINHILPHIIYIKSDGKRCAEGQVNNGVVDYLLRVGLLSLDWFNFSKRQLLNLFKLSFLSLGVRNGSSYSLNHLISQVIDNAGYDSYSQLTGDIGFEFVDAHDRGDISQSESTTKKIYFLLAELIRLSHINMNDNEFATVMDFLLKADDYPRAADVRNRLYWTRYGHSDIPFNIDKGADILIDFGKYIQQLESTISQLKRHQ